MTNSNAILARLVQWLEQSRPPVGTHLPAQQLADLLGVSRSPVGQALAVLAERGWLRRQPRRGYYVDRLPDPGVALWHDAPRAQAENVLQPFRLRLAVVPAALLEPGYRLAPAAIRRLRAAEARLHAAGNATRTQQELDFQEALTAAADNPYFTDTIRRLNRAHRLRIIADPRWRERSEQRLAVLDLLEQGRGEAASRLLASHLRSTLSGLADQEPGEARRMQDEAG
ncbi:GntR family transcriptional regulator [Bordetella pseudohinzii]|uniref:DNA-binding transcriptional repressor LldR n=1 Tax=Bordetella pseudohinzii TaxID=1331258 RepID=A0A0J6F4C9_9BORD|nr:GntR family transcriptional regulator [Bordetella pseudohinzii]ANY15389.1 hypothetical protein BBN53_05485 [Bordetella pseudohinzii]KMM27300.1 hypothetical protein L540_09895 [Bordetella pseudohinzii]KXA79399.1 hypothetical protein AW877_09160 [Bordetella pseudohinzii]KXA82516.1 hypothetical protein AW878_00555 [Bordetella pseudohinzii]CUI86458.1 DNA-binding transcriptional repressor LldR [Bordetella pseudohinzii]